MQEVQTMAHTLLLTIVSGALILATTYFSLYLKRFTKKLTAEAEKIEIIEKQQLATVAINRVNSLIYQTVFAMQVTTVEEKKRESENGRLTKEQAAQIMEKVKKQVKEQLNSDVINLLKLEINDVDMYIENRIELELDKVKKDLNI